MEMSYNARVLLKKTLASRMSSFSNECHGADGRFCETHGVNHSEEEINKELEDLLNDVEGLKKSSTYKPVSKPAPEQPARQDSTSGTPLTQQNYIKATGRGGAKQAASDHLMTQKEFIKLTGRGGANNAADDHPMTQKEFIETTGRGGAKKAANDHPMTMREFIEATGRGGAKKAPNDHPMTDEEFRKAYGVGKRR